MVLVFGSGPLREKDTLHSLRVLKYILFSVSNFRTVLRTGLV